MTKLTQRQTVQPRTKEALRDLIEDAMQQHGNQCDLNHIDVSLIDDFSYLFFKSKFNGGISDWNVLRAKHMNSMFSGSDFDGDISRWNTSKMETTEFMFHGASFNKDISKWNVSKVESMKLMFAKSKFNGDISKWGVSSVTNMRGMFSGARFNGDVSKWDVSGVLDMCYLFKESDFEGDVSRWERPLNCHDKEIFLNSKIAKKIIKKDPTFSEIKSYFLAMELDKTLQGASTELATHSKVRL